MLLLPPFTIDTMQRHFILHQLGVHVALLVRAVRQRSLFHLQLRNAVEWKGVGDACRSCWEPWFVAFIRLNFHKPDVR